MGRDIKAKVSSILPFEVEDDEYTKHQRLLIQNNFVMKQIIQSIRRQYEIPILGFKNNHEYNMWIAKIYKNNKQLFKDLYITCKALSQKLLQINTLYLDPQFILSLVYTGDGSKFLGDWYVNSVGLKLSGGYITTGAITDQGV